MAKAFFLLIVFTANSLFAQKGFTIKATLTGFPEGSKFYLLNLDLSTQKDSAFLKNGTLKFNGRVSEPATFRLYLDPKESKDFIYTTLWVSNQVIDFRGSKDRFSDLQFERSPLNDIFMAVNSKTSGLYNVRDKLMDQLLQDNSKSTAFETSIKEIDKEILAIRLHTIATLTPSLITIKELFFLRNDLTKDSLQLLFNKFPPGLQQTKYGKIITQYLATDQLKVGAAFADIKGKTLSGKETRLSDLKNKIILLDFWAAWCGPCRGNNQQLADLYNRYKDKGFEIVSFSIDTDFEYWKEAAQKDRISWTNISDLKGFYSEEAAKYKIRAIPKSFLIDRNGIIIEIFDGYNANHKAALEKKLSGLIK
ncbi:TlpA disulfide reductase family protein [Niabella drilacis]|uniref:Peroxiredoxin n=1 Tax=Niabella drilacis (strain DSM 25811 / CCM 8410 / CCUG 62505 / LMG 26954 / E90) TaxID=1285928 RepID=A0A1G6NA88_NIADE|nr:TlpA disulfide reductase family protein [Niabella drilacis]SDC64772.1 Peroxiredoxin [Niabella drilacis]